MVIQPVFGDCSKMKLIQLTGGQDHSNQFVCLTHTMSGDDSDRETDEVRSSSIEMCDMSQRVHFLESKLATLTQRVEYLDFLMESVLGRGGGSRSTKRPAPVREPRDLRRTGRAA
jgi:hypothetical protein